MHNWKQTDDEKLWQEYERGFNEGYFAAEQEKRSSTLDTRSRTEKALEGDLDEIFDSELPKKKLEPQRQGSSFLESNEDELTSSVEYRIKKKTEALLEDINADTDAETVIKALSRLDDGKRLKVAERALNGSKPEFLKTISDLVKIPVLDGEAYVRIRDCPSCGEPIKISVPNGEDIADIVSGERQKPSKNCIESQCQNGCRIYVIPK